jgi:hypothetical protein
VAVIQEAWISGVSTRKVDDLVQAMGLSGISKSSVSKLCKSLPAILNGHLPPRAHMAIWAAMSGGGLESIRVCMRVCQSGKTR